MSLTRQLALTLASVLLLIFALTTLAFLWQDAHAQLADQAHELATVAGRRFDPVRLQSLSDQALQTSGFRSVRVVDTDIMTLVSSTDPTAAGDIELSDAD